MSKIDKTHSLSVSRQCDLLDVPRSSFYYSPREDGYYNEELMKQIDKQYMITPFYGVPRMTHHLRGIGYEVNYIRWKGEPSKIEPQFIILTIVQVVQCLNKVFRPFFK